MMPRFFIENVSETMHITGENANHIIKSLRMKIGDEIILCDTQGYDYYCDITDIGKTKVVLKVRKKVLNTSEPDVYVRLFQAMPKGDKFETIIQKSIELGVSEIIPVLTDRCIARPDSKSMERKLARFNKIAQEAAKQSGRGIVPKVKNIVPFYRAVEVMVKDNYSILFYELGKERLDRNNLVKVKSISIMIGSEGGFSPAEIEAARSKGIDMIASLGPRILRCETAPICALTILMFQTNNI